MLNLDLLAQCIPFIAHASGKSLLEVHALPVEKAIYLCGKHGVDLLTRATELQNQGKSLEQELCVAEVLALTPLATMFKPVMPVVPKAD